MGHITTESILNYSMEGIARSEGSMKTENSDEGDRTATTKKKRKGFFFPQVRLARAHQARILILQRALQFRILELALVLPQ
jgi:hypothetical protein